MASASRPDNRPKPVPKAVTDALVRRKPSADSAQLLTDLIDVWGGTRRLAQDIYRQFKTDKNGNSRARILEMFTRLIVTNTQHEIGQSRQPSDMSNEELEAVASLYLERLSKKQDGGQNAP